MFQIGEWRLLIAELKTVIPDFTPYRLCTS
jgi:hypothetical protein